MPPPINTSLTLSPRSGVAPHEVQAVPLGTDVDDGPVEFRIDWGDYSSPTVVDVGEPLPQHTFESPGQYTVTATASTADGTVTVDDIVVTVAAVSNYPAITNTGGVCVPWVTVAEFCKGQETQQELVLLQQGIDTATRWLNDATGRRWSGPCTTFIRPFTDASCGTGMTTQHRGPIDLSRWVTPPVVEIIEIRVDGEPVDLSYAYMNGNRLVASTGWDDGDSPLIPWPTQNEDRQPGAVDTWDVTVLHGAGPPEPLREACRRLATEIVKQCCGASNCALPDNVSSVSRDGVTISFQPPLPGRTGIPFIDAQITLYGPEGLGHRRRMYDPAAPGGQIVRY